MKSKFGFVILVLAIVAIVVGILMSGYVKKPGEERMHYYWIRAIGGGDESFSYAPSIIVTNDGFIEIGYSDVRSGSYSFDVCIVKLDKEGNYLWSEMIGTEDSDKAYTIEKTMDGGYFVTGFVELPQVSKGLQVQEIKSGDILVIKLKSDMSIEWSRLIDTGTRDVSYSGRQTKDGGYIISGTTEINLINSERDVILVKLSRDGELEWAETIGGMG
jgi:hypothetical protein